MKRLHRTGNLIGTERTIRHRMDEDQQLIHAYLSGTLSERETEDFEQRLFADDALANELQRSMEIGAVARGSGKESAVTRFRDIRRTVVPLALAAGAAAVVFGLFRVEAPHDPAQVLRGIEQQMGIEARIADERLLVHWQPVPGAIFYDLRVLDARGQLVAHAEIDGRRSEAIVGFDMVADSESGPFSVELIALDSLRQTIVRSGNIEIEK